MPGSISRQLKQFSIMRWCSILIIIAGVTACAGSSQAASRPTPCQPEAGNANPYISTPHPWLKLIYTNSGITVQNSPADVTLLIPATGGQTHQTLASRHAALQFLIKETMRWSDTKTIKLDNSSEAHIVVTFLHPELLQAIYLNEILKNTLLVSEIETQMNEVMTHVSRRDELLFMLTVIANHRDPLNIARHTLDLPIGEMKLINAGDTSVPPMHDDHNLDQPIDTTQNPAFGFIGYPIGIQSNNGCIWVLDTTYNTNIVIVVNSIVVDGLASGPHAWTIRYQSLIDSGLPIDVPDFSLPSYDIALLSSTTIPPGNTNDENFWRDYSRFIWGQVTFGN